MTPDAIKQAIEEVLNDRARIDATQHSEHHEYVALLIRREQQREERWEEIKRQVLGWGIIALAGSLGTYVAQKMGVYS